jgi:hypothetical protein
MLSAMTLDQLGAKMKCDRSVNGRAVNRLANLTPRIASATNVTLMASLQRSIQYRLIGRANWLSKLARWAGRALYSPNRPQTRAIG